MLSRAVFSDMTIKLSVKYIFWSSCHADWSQGMLAIIQCRICSLPVCYPKI